MAQQDLDKFKELLLLKCNLIIILNRNEFIVAAQ